MSPDDNEFEQIYRSLPPGLVVVACGGGYFRPLQSFCFSLKAAAIRIGTNAVHFDRKFSREDWESSGGAQYIRDFIDRHHAHGIRVFFIDESPATGSGSQRAAELLRSQMVVRSIDQEIAAFIQEEALGKKVTIILTALAEVVAEEHSRKALADLDVVIHQRQASVESMRRALAEMERQFQIPDSEAAIAALSDEVAAQIREAHDALPGMVLKFQQTEAHVAELLQTRKRLNKKRSPSQSVTLIKTSQYSGTWKGILLEQSRVDDDWYSATISIGPEIKRHGPLYFLWECPQPPKPQTGATLEPKAGLTPKRAVSWFRRLLGQAEVG